jgi:flagellar P-ring protein precursor FlgI
MSGRFKYIFSALLFLAASFPPGSADAARIKDIAFIEGVRSNQLVGYGLVVGLSGTGDKTSAVYTMQSIANMLNRMGLKLDQDDIKVKNTAAVIITATLPPFVKPGSKIDVVVSSLGDASSLQGGTLIMSPLKGPDGAVYAMAQGPVALAGFSAGGTTKVTKNHQTVAKLTNGAIIERELPLRMSGMNELAIIIKNPDFTTARRLAESINKGITAGIAKPKDAGRVIVTVPAEYRDNIVEYISRIEILHVTPDSVTKVVVNERTGTVVMGENITLSTVAITHADLTIEIKTQYLISQPSPFSSRGETVVQPVERVRVDEGESRLIILPGNVTLGEVVRALNLLGVTPRDLVAILQAIKAAGALQADMEII